MLNLINNSVRSLNKRLTNMVNGYTDSRKLNVNFCKFDILHLNFYNYPENDGIGFSLSNENDLLKEYNVLYIVHSDVNLEIFYITNEGDLKCFISQKFSFPLILVDSMLTGIFDFYPKELPIISITSNLNDKVLDLENNSERNFLKFYSLKSKRIIHNLRFKNEIISFNSKPNFFVIGFIDGYIKCFDGKLKNFLTIQTNNIADAKYQKENISPSYNISISSDWKAKSRVSKLLEKEKAPIYDISENHILYFYNHKKETKEVQSVPIKEVESDPCEATLLDLDMSKRTQSFNSEFSGNNFHYPKSNYYNTIESLAVETYKNLSKLKDWSLNQLNDYSNLRNATKISNNLDFTKEQIGHSPSNFSSSKYSYLILQKVNLDNENKDEIADDIISNATCNSQKKFNNENSFKIKVPFFEEGISMVKFFKNSKYFIVGNKDSQMFYIYECFPQSNLKYTKDYDFPGISNISKNSIYSFKISYSIYRGLTTAIINDVDFSEDKKCVVLSSNKGTFHLFSLPKLENQIIENSVNSDYTNFDNINQKIVNATDIDKIKLGSLFPNNKYKSTCKFVNLPIDKLGLTNRENYSSKSKVLYTFIDNISAVQVHLIDNSKEKNDTTNNTNNNNTNNSDNSFLLKSIQIGNTVTEEIDKNLNELRKIPRTFNNEIGSNNHLINFVNKMKSQFQEFLDIETTDQNFPKIHLNPLFSISIYTQDSNKTNKSLTNLNIIKENIYDHLESTTEYKSSKSILIVDQSEKNNENKIQVTTNLHFPSNISKKQIQNLSIIKSRSNSISQKINPNNNNNSYSNDLIIHEKMLSKNFKYSQINNFQSINNKTRKTDGSLNKFLFHPSNYSLFKNKLKKKGLHKNSSISDSSSLENSISLNNINNTSFETDNRQVQIIKQIHKEMETNMSDKLNKNINVVKVVSNFNIDDNYYGQK